MARERHLELSMVLVDVVGEERCAGTGINQRLDICIIRETMCDPPLMIGHWSPDECFRDDVGSLERHHWASCYYAIRSMHRDPESVLVIGTEHYEAGHR